MNEPSKRTDLAARDIRTPRSTEEAEQAIVVATARLQSIDRDLAKPPAANRSNAENLEWRGRAERARSVWCAKLQELEYWRDRLAADGDPERAQLAARAEGLRLELHRSWARVAQLSEGQTLPAELRSYIDARREQLPEGFYDAFVAGWVEST